FPYSLQRVFRVLRVPPTPVHRPAARPSPRPGGRAFTAHDLRGLAGSGSSRFAAEARTAARSPVATVSTSPTRLAPVTTAPIQTFDQVDGLHWCWAPNP